MIKEISVSFGKKTPIKESCLFSAILIVLIVSGIIDYFWVKGICSIVLIGVFIAMFIAYNYVSNKKDAILLSIIKDKFEVTPKVRHKTFGVQFTVPI